MASVPSGFQPEPGETACGDSWPETISVTGELPGTGGYGRDKHHELGRVAILPTKTAPGATPGTWYSYDTPAERGFIVSLDAAADKVNSELDEAAEAGELNIQEKTAISYLMKLADANLERAENLYKFWRGEGKHPQHGDSLQSEWPLPAGDDIAKYMAECEGVRGEWVDDRELVGSEVQTVRFYYCPSGAIEGRRASDRNTIGQLLIHAAEAIRCAHWGLWRTVLYNEAYEEWSEYQTALGFGQPPGEYVDPLGVGAREGEYVPPLGVEAREGVYVPPLGFESPGHLPPIPDPDEPEPEPGTGRRLWPGRRMGEAEPEVEPDAEPEVEPEPAPAPKKGRMVLGLAALAAGVLLLPKLLK